MSSPEGGIERVKAICARRWRLGAAVAVLLFGAAVGGIAGLRSVYRATATVLIQPEAGSENEAPAQLEARLHVIGQEILARTRVAELVERFDLYPQLRHRVSDEAILQRFRNDVKVEMKEAQEPGGSRGRTVAFMISYRGLEREKVAEVANALADAYVQQDTRERAGTAESLEAQLGQVKRQLDDQEKRLGAFRVHHAGELGAQVDMTYSTLERLNSEIRAAADTRMRAMERRSMLLKEMAEAAPAASGDADATAARLAKLNQDLAEMHRRYTDKYPDVQKLKAEIANLERQAAEPRRRAPDTSPASQHFASLKEALRQADDEIRVAREEEATLKGQVDEYRRRADAAPGAGQSLLELSRDYETTKALYASLLRRYEEARLAAGAGPADAAADAKNAPRPRHPFQLLEPAAAPIFPVAPHRLRLLFAALVVALAAGVGTVMIAQGLDETFHSVDELRSFTRVPVVVSIPTLLTEDDLSRQRRRRHLALAALLLGVVVVGQASYRLAQRGLVAAALPEMTS